MTLHIPLATFRGVFRQLLWRNTSINRSASPLLARSWANGSRAPLQPPSIVWTRGAKRQSKKMLSELPQGIIALEPLPSAQEPKYPPVIEQARANMNKLPNNVLITRVGSFYELYFEHAEQIGPLLNLKVSQKRAGPTSVSMAGFPFYQLDRMVKSLVQDHNLTIALCEEFPNSDPDKLGPLFERKITRIISPGTLIDEKFMDPCENNYLLALSTPPITINSLEDASKAFSQKVGLAWLDASTGDFYTQETTVAELSGDIWRIGPREVLLSDTLKGESGNYIAKKMEDEKLFLTYYKQPPESPNQIDSWDEMLESPVAKPMKSKFSELEVQAASNLLYYIKNQLPGINLTLQPPIKRFKEEIMAIDSNSMRGLEIKRTLRDGTAKGSLVHTVKRTVTKSGARLLSSWLTTPSTSLKTIEDRLDLVEFFYNKNVLREEVAYMLRRTIDLQRLAQRFSIGRGTADDLISLARTIEAMQLILSRLSREVPSARTHSLGALVARMEIPTELARKINDSIDEEGLILQQKIQESQNAELVAMTEAISEPEGSIGFDEGNGGKLKISKDTDTSGYFEGKSGLSRTEPWLMLRCASPTLEKLHKRLDKQFEKKKELTEELRVNLGVTSLLLKWTPGQGHFCHVKGKDVKATLEKIPETISASRSVRTFQVKEWTELGSKIDQTRLQLRAEEQIVFRKLRDEVIRNIGLLRKNAAVLDEMDVSTSFAELAREKGWIRPILNSGSTHKIYGGRHPMVEDGLGEDGRKFTPNDCIVGGPERLWLITGPNMAGKSTFLRQNALISILAQVGCYVPADYAEIGIVDQVFSRVGSADNLFRDQSTFMVEMLEASDILRKATPRSFVIIDEIGRGTSPAEGTAIAFACLDHLYRVNQSRTLFATHFHEIVDWTTDYKEIGYYCTDIQENSSGSFTYIHALRKGVNRDSHALKVAQLAGIPSDTIAIARKKLRELNQEVAKQAPAPRNKHR
ncbi:muts domain V-domain-containing protein [Peziza echinospora]|nr:muts domain V-domain-containing protein [Peziza echinospora]